MVMEWIEFIHLRSHSAQDMQRAVRAFHALDFPDKGRLLRRISLFQNHVLELDLGIVLEWSGDPGPGAKSALGLQLTRAFGEFGQINHTGWTRQTALFPASQEKYS